MSLQSWWDGPSSTSESKTAILLLLSKLLQVEEKQQIVQCEESDLFDFGLTTTFFFSDLDWLLRLLKRRPQSVPAGVFHFHSAAGRHESASESQGNTRLPFLFCPARLLKPTDTEFDRWNLLASSESGPVGVAVFHNTQRRAASWAAESSGRCGCLPLPHAVRRVRQGLAAPQQLHGLYPEGDVTVWRKTTEA